MTNAELIAKIKAEIERRIALYSSLSENTVNPNRIDEDRQILRFLSTLEESERPEPYNPVYDEAYLNEKIKKATESWKGVDVDAMLAECRGYDEEKSEKPMNQEGLEKEIERCVIEPYYDLDGVAVKGATAYITVKDVADIARHFAQWGAEHLANSNDEVAINGHKVAYDKDKDAITMEEIPNDLEEAAEHYASVTDPEAHGIEFMREVFIAGAKWQKEHEPTKPSIMESFAKSFLEIGARQNFGFGLGFEQNKDNEDGSR